MDPTSIVGLVGACLGLTRQCASVIKTLHGLRETFEDAELAILSIAEECETIQFAWRRISQWASNLEGKTEDQYFEIHMLDLYDTLFFESCPQPGTAITTPERRPIALKDVQTNVTSHLVPVSPPQVSSSSKEMEKNGTAKATNVAPKARNILPPREKDRQLLKRAFREMHAARELDYAQDYAGATKAYKQFCHRMQQFILACPVYKYRFAANIIRDRYLERIEELSRYNPRPLSKKVLREQTDILRKRLCTSTT